MQAKVIPATNQGEVLPSCFRDDEDDLVARRHEDAHKAAHGPSKAEEGLPADFW